MSAPVNVVTATYVDNVVTATYVDNAVTATYVDNAMQDDIVFSSAVKRRIKRSNKTISECLICYASCVIFFFQTDECSFHRILVVFICLASEFCLQIGDVLWLTQR